MPVFLIHWCYLYYGNINVHNQSGTLTLVVYQAACMVLSGFSSLKQFHYIGGGTH